MESQIFWTSQLNWGTQSNFLLPWQKLGRKLPSSFSTPDFFDSISVPLGGSKNWDSTIFLRCKEYSEHVHVHVSLVIVWNLHYIKTRAQPNLLIQGCSESSFFLLTFHSTSRGNPLATHSNEMSFPLNVFCSVASFGFGSHGWTKINERTTGLFVQIIDLSALGLSPS